MIWVLVTETSEIKIFTNRADIPDEYLELVQEVDINESDTYRIYIDSNGNIALKTDEEILEEYKQFVISKIKSKLRSLLSNTDWVVMKLISMEKEGYTEEEIASAKQRYGTLLRRRKKARKWAKSMIGAVINSTTKEQIDSIVRNSWIKLEL